MPFHSFVRLRALHLSHLVQLRVQHLPRPLAQPGGGCPGAACHSPLCTYQLTVPAARPVLRTELLSPKRGHQQEACAGVALSSPLQSCRFVFLILSCTNCLYILEINSMSVASFAVIFFHVECCLFPLLMVSLALQCIAVFLTQKGAHTSLYQKVKSFLQWSEVPAEARCACGQPSSVL